LIKFCIDLDLAMYMTFSVSLFNSVHVVYLCVAVRLLSHKNLSVLLVLCSLLSTLWFCWCILWII